MPRGKLNKAHRSYKRRYGNHSIANDGTAGIIDVVFSKGNVPRSIVFNICKDTKKPIYSVYDYNGKEVKLLNITNSNREKYKEYLSVFNQKNREAILDMYMKNM